MAATFKVVPNSENVNGKMREIMLDFTPDTNLGAGGAVISPAIAGMKTILECVPVAQNTGAIAAGCRYNMTTGKVTLYNGATELTGDQHLLTFRLLVKGY